MQRPLNRRDFLKLAAMLPVFGIPPRIFQGGGPNVQQFTPPNIIFLVFDTLSAKHMSLYGYPRETTPNLARFAQHATVFQKHYAGGNFTSPGTASLLTGSHAWSQRAFNFQGTVTPEFERKNIFRVFEAAAYFRVTYTHNWLVGQLLNQFRPDISYWKPLRDLCLTDTEISDKLFPNDHDVALSVERTLSLHNPGGAGSLFLSMLDQVLQTRDARGLARDYAALFPRGLPSNGETTLFILEDAINWVQEEAKQAQRPFVAYVHLLPPHEPYNPRREFIGRFDSDGFAEPPKPIHPLSTTSFDEPQEGIFRKHYDEMIAYADAEFGRLYDYLLRSGILDNAYLIFTSDHGQILERGTRGHLNRLLYEAITRVPLIISNPGQKQRVDVWSPTSAVDLLPTLAHLTGQPVPDWSDGEVLPTFGGVPTTGRSVFTIEAKSNPKHAPITKASLSMIKGQYKLIQYLGYGNGYDDSLEVYDLKNDPEELMDLQSSNPPQAVDLRTELMEKLQAVNRPYSPSGT
jgi:arylsulfatase A-like enzyme